MRIETNGVGLEVRVEGPDDGAPVVLLHGWPDRASLWDAQIVALNDAGFRTVAPDLRGFGDSDKPVGVEHYNILTLAGDVLGVLDHLEIATARVVGHDWGSALAWAVAGFAADRVEKLVAMSVGHPSLFAAAGLEQRRLSWYMLLFQFEDIAEQWLSNDDFANMRAFGAGHLGMAQVVADSSRPGALTAGLSWYRANVPPESLVAPALAFPPVTVPTMGIWSSGDAYLVESPMRDAGSQVSASYRYERIDGASHWMQLDATDEVNRLLLEFLP
jgi:pimeloyl-ACP methyl ester carboxylesterase